jgi:aspartyl-tRNA(Asn)/glutamyl-tRNA(Gln) amidotransferase subunit A
MAPLALGSDTGGSIRQPASFCGVVGLKPTYGSVSRYGLIAFASSLDQIGPIANTVEDAALLQSVIQGYDAGDSTSSARETENLNEKLNADLSRKKIGVPSEFFNKDLDVEVRAKVEESFEVLKSAGAELVEIHLPHLKYSLPCYYLLATAEASSNLARYEGVHYSTRATGKHKDIIDLYSESREQGFGDEVKRRIMLGTYTLSSGYYDAYYLKAAKVRRLIQQDYLKAFEKVDLIGGPTAPTTAFKSGEKSGDPVSMYLSDIFTLSLNLAGMAGLSIPIVLDSRGLPIGLQIQGGYDSEKEILSAALAVEKEFKFFKQVPDLAKEKGAAI